MPFSEKSEKRLALAHPDLQRVMRAARENIVFEILDSQRGKIAQEKAFREGHSKAHFGQSAHNWSPSLALDIIPTPLDWEDLDAFIALSKVILPLAKQMKIEVSWGGLWQKLKDFPHYELTDWRTRAKTPLVKPFPG